MNQPPFLKPGDQIGIVSSAGMVTKDEIQFSIGYFTNAGYNVVIGKTIGSTNNYFAGTDSFRFEELQDFLDNPEIRAIVFARGGYGTIQIIDKLDFSGFLKAPKWLCGFSDLTVLHNHLLRNFNIAVIHGPMAKTLKNNQSAAFLLEILTGRLKTYHIPPNPNNIPGVANGNIIGGNLSVLNSLCGSKSDFDPNGNILFLEDISEYYYQIDRMLWAIRRSKDCSLLNGVIVGDFSRIKDNQRTFGKNIYELITSHFEGYNIPLMFGFHAGHNVKNYPFYMGSPVRLTVGEKKCRIDFL